MDRHCYTLLHVTDPHARGGGSAGVPPGVSLPGAYTMRSVPSFLPYTSLTFSCCVNTRAIPGGVNYLSDRVNHHLRLLVGHKPITLLRHDVGAVG
jgi:hypothetical protein